MMTITIPYTTPRATRETLEAALDREFETNPNLNGEEFEIDYGAWASVDGCDELVGTALLAQINEIIDGRKAAPEQDED